MKHTFTFLLLLAAMAMAPMGLQAQSSCDITLPWSENFDSYTTDGGTAFPTCWTRFSPFQLNNTTTRPNFYVFGAGTHGTVLNFNGQANHSSSPSGVMRIATPRIPAQLNHLELSFEVAGDGLMIYAATDTANTSTFVLIGTFSGPSLYAWSSYELHTDTIAGIPSDTGYIVFAAAYGNSGYSTARLDNLTVTAINACERPSSVTVDLVGVTTASLSWPDVAAAQDYLVSYDTVNDITNAASVTADNNTVTLTDLEPGATYYVWVQSNCGNGSYSDARTATLTTQLSCYSITGLTQVSSTFEAASFQWDFDTRGNSPTGVLTVLHDLTDPLIPDVVELSTGTNSHIFTNLDNTHEYSVSFYTLCDGDTANGVDAYIIFRNCGESALFTGANDHSADFPLASAYGTSYSQVLYDADVLYSMDTIRGVALHRFVGSSGSPISRTLSLYMGHTSLDSLTSNQGTTGLTRVASGVSYNLAAQEWDTLLFTTPFVYDGTSNVVITIDDNTSGNTGSNSAWWRFHPTLTGRMFISMADNVNIDPAGPTFPTSGYNTQRNILPDMHFVGICHNDGSCEAPMVAVAAVGETDAEITWFGGTGTEWMVEYRPMGGEQWILADTTDGSPYELTGLTPGTNYEVRVGVVCTGTDRYSGTATFTTVCAQVSVPFHFTQSEMVAAAEAGFSPCWSFSDNFCRGTLSDSHRGYVRNVGNNQWFMLPAVNRPLQGTRFRTWVGVGSDTDMKIGVATQNDCSDVEWLDTITIPGSNVNYGHVEVTYYFDDYEGDARRVVASPIIPTQDAIYVYYFDFHIEVEECRPVADLVLDSTDASTLSISWTPRSQQSQWIVYVGDEVVGTTDIPSYTIRNLEAYSPYAVSVRGICSGGDTTAATTATFRTGCTGESCTFSIHCTTTADNGWQGAYIGVAAQTGDDIQDFEVLGSVTMVNANRVVRTFAVCADYPVHFSWSSGNNDLVCTFDIVNEAGDTIYHSQGGKVDSRYPADQDNLGPSFYVDSAICPSGVGPEPVGIDVTASKTLALYPNPASTSVTLTGMENGAVVTLLDFSGREVMRRSTTGDRMNISLDGLAKGAYFVRVAGKSSVATRKLIVR